MFDADGQARRAQIGEGVTITDTLIMGADFYDPAREKEPAEGAAAESGARVPLGVGAGSSISNCILDKNARVGKNVTIRNAAGVEEANLEDKGYYIRSGIVVVLKNATIPDGTVI